MGNSTYNYASFRMPIGDLIVVVHIKGCDEGHEATTPEQTAAAGRLLVDIAEALEAIRDGERK